MRKFLLGLLLAALPAIASAEGGCPTCIQNSAAAQNAQFNVSSATIRGVLTVGELNMSTVTASTITAGAFFGDGNKLTNLNASQLLSGTIPSAAVSGTYPGITSVGAISAGTWHGNPIGTQWGGTGQNFVNVSTGSLIYFSNNGIMSTLLPGDPQGLLQTNGYSAPVWTSSPSVSGIHIYGIPLTALAAGTLPTSIIVSSNSIPYVSGASIVGNISGAAAVYTGPIQLSQLSSGTLSNFVVASSITVTQVLAGVYGDSSHIPQIKFQNDGRASTVTVLALSVPLTDLQNGTLPNGVTVPATSINAGVLNGSVIASSVAATGVTPGTYGDANHSVQVTFGGDGRATNATNVLLPTLLWSLSGADIVPSSVTNRVVVYSSMTAGAFFGDGSHLTGIVTSSSSFTGGTITNATDFLSSVTFHTNILTRSSNTAGAFFGDGSHLTGITSSFNGGTISNETDFLSSVTFHTNTLTTSSVTAGAFFGNGYQLSNLVCGLGSGTPSVLCNPAGSANTSGGTNSVTVGGASNSASNTFSSVFGGQSNVASAAYASVVGGQSDTASGINSIALGGVSNTASGLNALAAGERAFADQDGAFVFADDTNSDYHAHTVNSFNVRATGGFFFDSPASIWVSSGSLTVVSSSVTASAFYGDGSHLNGLPCKKGSGLNSVACQGDGTNTASGISSVVSGGGNAINANAASGNFCTIGGGGSNGCSSNFGTIGGGDSNGCSTQLCTIAGGQNNHATGDSSSIGGGASNTAAGQFSTIAGGIDCQTLGNSSFASGFAANALSPGSWVWHSSDSAQGIAIRNSDKVYDNGTNTFNVYAVGGIYLSSGTVHIQNNTIIAGVTFVGAQTSVALRTLACAVLPCQANNSTDFDIYTATAVTSGSWRNSRTGLAP